MYAHIIISIIYNFSKVGNLGKYNSFGFSRHSHCCFALLPTPSHSFCVDFPISFQLTSLIFSHSYLQITLTYFCSFYCLFPATVHFHFPGSCGSSGLYTHIWRFGVRNHRWERKAMLVFLSLGYLTQYTIFLVILGYIASSKSAWLTWALASKEEKRIWERIWKPILFMIWKNRVEVLLVIHSEFQAKEREQKTFQGSLVGAYIEIIGINHITEQMTQDYYKV